MHRSLNRLARITIVFIFAMYHRAPAHDGGPLSFPQPPALAQAEASPVPPPGPATRRLTIRIVDAASGEILPGVVHITNEVGDTLRPAELLPRTTALSEGSLGAAAFDYMNRWYVLPDTRTVTLPRGNVTVTAFSGIHSTRVSRDIDLDDSTDVTLDIPLEPVAPFHPPEMRAGNVHLHLQKMTLHEAERYATEVARGDGIDVVFLSYLERAEADVHYISNAFTKADLARFHDRSGVLFGYGEEYRHNFAGQQGYGHVMFLDLYTPIRPASFGYDIMKTGNDDGVLQTGILQARERQATILWCHNAYGHEDIPNWVAGLIDGQIVFDGGAVGGYDDGFYRYLNIGLKVPLSMGTDWFYNDMALTMVPVKEGLTTEAWLAALRSGRSYITNGPLLDVVVDDARPGDTIALAAPDTVAIRARAASRNDFGGLELVANGHVIEHVQTENVNDRFVARLNTTLNVNASTWIAVRATPFQTTYHKPEVGAVGFNEYGKPLFAHTSPIYIQVGDKPVFIPEAAESLRAELRSSMVTIRHTGAYSNDAERDRVLAVYEAAMANLKRRLAG